ncbi:MAG: DUF3857 domain-containing protein [Bryocella sp.]
MSSFLRYSATAFSFVLLFLPACKAQTKVSNPFADESYVIRQNDWVYSENADGTGFREHTVAVTIQSDAAIKVFGVVGIPFAGATEHVTFRYARVRHKDGSTTETPADGMMEEPQPVTQQAPFYSDLKMAELPIKNLQVGDTLEWQAHIERTRAEAPGHFWGQESFLEQGAVVLEESLELRVPAESAAIVWSNPELAVQPTKRTEGKVVIYTLKTSQLQPTAGPIGEADKKAKQGKAQTHEQEMDSENGKLPSLAWSSFHDWAEVGAWYRQLQGTRTVPDAEITAKAKSLIEGKTTEEEKVRALYAYVSTQIRYIGVAFGVGRFQPHDAVDVLHNQYGDCKDKETLLAALLAAAGVPSDAALIGADMRFNDAVPSPGSFNHLITHLRVGGQEVWLDSTEEIAPYRAMVATIRDKQALVIPPQGTPVIETTPADLPFAALDTWTAKGTLDSKGTAESHIVLTMRSDSELVLRAVMRQVPPSSYDDAVQRLVNAEGYAGTTSHAVVTRPDDTTQPFSIAFDYHREKPGDWDNLRIYPQVLLLGLPAVDEKKPPTEPLDMGTMRTQTSHAELKLPEGWNADVPAPEHRKSEWVTYDEVTRQENGVLITNTTMKVLQRYVPMARWKDYKAFYDSVDVMQTIQLLRGAATDGSAESKPINKDALAGDLIDQATEAMQQQRWDDAEADLKRAKSKDSKAPRLWSSFARLELMRGEANQAIEDSRKELALHPHVKSAYMTLVSGLLMRNKHPEAITALQQWIDDDTADSRPELMLAILQIDAKRYPAAMEAAEKAAELLGPEEAAKNERLQLVLGEAQLKSGLTAKGEATLTKLLNSTTDLSSINGAAYEMADEHVALPLDETKVLEALKRMDDETQDWTVDSKPATVNLVASLLYATWDTMGWIYFREGKLPEAREYVQAALINSPNAVITDHLERIEKPKTRPLTPVDMQRIADLTSSQKQRTFPMGKLPEAKGVVEYKLLLVHGHIDRVEPATDKTQPGAEDALKGMDVSRLMPKNSGAKLVKHGMVNCVNGLCDLILLP